MRPGTFGGSIGAILLNIPGTGAAIMTTLDGYPMRLRGEAGRAIGLAATSSLFGGLVSAFFLVAAAPVAARWAIRLGAHEYFAVAPVRPCGHRLHQPEHCPRSVGRGSRPPDRMCRQ